MTQDARDAWSPPMKPEISPVLLRQAERPLVVGLMWHSLDSPNLGVAALTHAQIHLVEAAAADMGIAVEFVLIGWVSSDTREDAPIAACQINARTLLGVKPDLSQALVRCDLVLDIGEGDSFSDIYGWKRFAYLVLTKLRVVWRGKPLVLSPQTIGPFRNPLARWVSDRALNQARLVFSRDGLSSRYLESRKLAAPWHEAIDVAFALPFERSEKAAGRTRIGLNVSGLLWAGGYTGANQFGLRLDYRKTIVALVDALLEHDGVDVVVVPHVVVPARREEDDLYASRELVATRPQLAIAGPFDSPVAVKSFISGLDFFVGARMHACIAAFSAGVACVPMAYSRKFVGLFNTLEYPHVADCTSEDARTVLDKIGAGFAQRAQLTDDVTRGNAIAVARLNDYRKKLATLLGEVRGG